MIWKKCGLIWEPNQSSEKFHKYGILPVPVYLSKKNVVRVFFGSADNQNHSRIYSLDLNPNNLNEILDYPNRVLLDIGRPGTFDDSGVVPSSIILIDEKYYLYTVGFQRTEKVPYMLFPGIAISEDDGETFMKPHESPIMPRNNFRPTSHGAPCVLNINNKFLMWHWFSTKWIMIEGKQYLDYQIGFADSTDGINWDMKQITCIEPDLSKGEFAVARPFVIFENNLFKMWYSIRSVKKLYRIGYAESFDGIKWIRKDDELGIDVSESGWDSEMICYSSIIKLKNKTYMFYNGNNNGESGFGYAELIDL